MTTASTASAVRAATDEEYFEHLRTVVAPYASSDELQDDGHYCDFIDCECGRYRYSRYDREAMYGGADNVAREEDAIADFERQLAAI
jgi:hypothetical protein